VFVVPERFSVEKQQLMRALGAEVVNTPSEDGMGFAIDRAHEIADETTTRSSPAVLEPAQRRGPLRDDRPEIDEALDGEVGAVVAGCGTGGTLMGMARYFRERDPDTYVVAVEPAGSAYREFLGEEVAHEEYKTEGIGTHDIDTNELFDPALVDDIQAVPDREVPRGDGAARGRGGTARRLLRGRERDRGQASRSGDSRRRDRRPVRHGRHRVSGLLGRGYLSKGVYRSFEEWEG